MLSDAHRFIFLHVIGIIIEISIPGGWPSCPKQIDATTEGFIA